VISIAVVTIRATAAAMPVAPRQDRLRCSDSNRGQQSAHSRLKHLRRESMGARLKIVPRQCHTQTATAPRRCSKRGALGGGNFGTLAKGLRGAAQTSLHR
jgi:hypothetical protein